MAGIKGIVLQLSLFFLVIIFAFSCKTKVLLSEINSAIPLNQPLLLIYNKNYLKKDTYFEDSTFIIFQNKELTNYHGFTKWYSFIVANDSFHIIKDDTNKSLDLNNFIIDNARIKPLREYLNLKNTMLKQKYSYKNGDTIFLKSRLIERSVKFILNSDGGVKRIIEEDQDEKYYFHHLTTYSFINVDSSFNPFLKLDTVTNLNLNNSKGLIQIPLIHLNGLDSFNLIQNKRRKNTKTVLIYSYIGCPPCTKLKLELINKVKAGKLDKESVIIVNVQDKREALEKYINHYKIPFSYYQIPNECMQNAYPINAFYNSNGDLVSSESGYEKKVINRILNYVRN